MDTTPQPLAPDLQTSLRHLRRIVLGGALALALLGGAAGLAAPAHAAAIGKDPELPVTNLTRKVNEYEGQHRLSSKDPELPVTPTLTRKVNEYEGQH